MRVGLQPSIAHKNWGHTKLTECRHYVVKYIVFSYILHFLRYGPIEDRPLLLTKNLVSMHVCAGEVASLTLCVLLVYTPLSTLLLLSDITVRNTLIVTGDSLLVNFAIRALGKNRNRIRSYNEHYDSNHGVFHSKNLLS